MEHTQNADFSSQPNYLSYVALFPYYSQYNVPVYPITILNYTVPIQLISSDSNLDQKFPPQIYSSTQIPVDRLEPQLQPIVKQQVKKRKRKQRIQQMDCQLSDNFKEIEDSEYRVKKTDKISKKRTKKAKPNQERNIIPNLIQQVFSFLSKKSRSVGLVQKIFHKFNIFSDAEISRFYIYQSKIKQKLDHCVNTETLKILTDQNWNPDQFVETFTPSEIRLYQKISRISAKYFLSHISPLLTLHSKRMPDWKRFYHLNRRRNVINHLK